MRSDAVNIGHTRRHPLFRIFGFEIKIDASWILLALLIVWTLAAGLFPYTYPGLSEATYWWMAVVGAAGIFLSIVFHELSHSLVARRFGTTIKGITLFIFGGVAEMEDEPPDPRAEFLMAGAGPVASFLLAFIFYVLSRLGENASWPESTVGVFAYLGYLNFILAIFNMVPAFPLDGGRMLRAALWQWKHRLTDATRIASAIGRGFAWLLMILGAIAFFQGNFIGGMWWFLIGLFLRSAAVGAYRQVVVRELLQGEPINRMMTPDPVTVAPTISLQQLVDDYIYGHHFRMFPVVEGERLLGCVTLQDVREVPRGKWRRRTVGELVRPCSPDNTVPVDSDSARVLSLMSRPGAPGRMMVVDGQRLAGVVSLKDLRSFISLKLDLEATHRR
jgi:Zn-dependent protease/CBS domain-containing protein